MDLYSVFSFPKVLIVGYFDQSKPVGITTNNMFKLWPSDKIAVASFNDIQDIHSPVCKNYYCLGNEEINIRLPLKFFNSVSSSKIYKNKEISISNNNRKEKYKVSFLKTLVIKILHFFMIKSGLNLIRYKYKLSDSFNSWINDFNPDVIYCTIEDIGRMQFITRLKQKTGRKIAIHIMDDWIHTSHKYTLFLGYWKRKLRNEFKQLINISDINFAISKKMALEYEEKYVKKFYIFHNPIDATSRIQHNATNQTHDKFLFIYSGRIGKHHAESILQFIKEIETPDFRDRINFRIYSTTDIKKVYTYLKKNNTEKYYHGSLKYKEIPKTLANADGLFLPLSFSKKSSNYTRLSMPTKVTEYMISGNPIFCYTPKDTAVAEYLEENHCAYLVNDKELLYKGIQDFINNKKLRYDISNNAKNLVKMNHDILKITKDLTTALSFKE